MTNRIMIVGQPGSGKSTLAAAIGRRTGLPVVHVDMIHWKSGWVERNHDEKIALALAEEAKPRWVFEGGLSATWRNRLSRADSLVVLDMPLWRRAWRVFRRTIEHHGKTRNDLPDGCSERFQWEFWSYIWRTRSSARRKMLDLMQQAGSSTDVVHLRSPGEVRTYLGNFLETRWDTRDKLENRTARPAR